MPKKKVLILGSYGKLGSEFVRFLRAKTDYHLVLPKSKECDIVNIKQVSQWIEKGLSLVINCAAITDMDYCEKDPQEALMTNVLGPFNIYQTCQKKNIELMHFGSTHDRELINIYALTKYLSTQIFIRKGFDKFYVFRIDSLFGGDIGKDEKFVGLVLEGLKTGNKIGITNNRYTSPTYTKDLVKFCWRYYQGKKYGIYEVGNQGRVTRWQLANQIAKICAKKHNFYINNNFKEKSLRIKDSSVKTKYLRPYQNALKEYIYESHF